MAGRGITDLRRPPKRYRVQGKAKFETREKAAREDRIRADMLRALARADPEQATALRSLADRVDPAFTKKLLSIASSRFMRHYRGRIAGWLWRLCDAGKRYDLRTFTLLPRNMSYTASELADVDPRKLRAALRADLLRAGSRSARGFLFAALHGEYDAATGLFRLHWHGVATRSMCDVISRLRGQDKYKARREGSQDDAVRTPVRVGRKSLTKLPAPLTYLVQSWWPRKDRESFEENGEGATDSPRRRRIPEPAHSAYLLWLDKWRLQDLVLMVRLRVIDGRLQPRK